MIGLMILIAVFIWIAVGFMLWKALIYPRFSNKLILSIVTIPLLAIWLIGPVLDEILGAREFERQCAELPPVTFYGPIELGSGDYFDENGKPRWSNKFEFNVIDRKSDEAKWESKSTRQGISKYPMPIGEHQTLYVVKKTGKPIVLSRTLVSPGGWLRRTLDLGVVLKGYNCRNKGFPEGEATVIFKKD